jgi:hypothetical protein
MFFFEVVYGASPGFFGAYRIKMQMALSGCLSNPGFKIYIQKFPVGTARKEGRASKASC